MMEAAVILFAILAGANTVMLLMCLLSLNNIADNLQAIIEFAEDQNEVEQSSEEIPTPQAEIVSPGNVHMPDRLADLLMKPPPTDLGSGTFEGRREWGPPPPEQPTI